MRKIQDINPKTSASVSTLLQTHVQAAAGLHVQVRTVTARFGAPYIAVMKGLAQVGCSFSIDNIQSPDLDMSRLRELNVRFVKIEAAQLIRMGDTHNGIDVVQRFKHNLLSAGAAMIVERIETERDLRELLDFEVDYGEGFLFGKPDLEIAYRPRKTA